MAWGPRVLTACLILGVASACSSAEQDTCASGLTKVCLDDGTTCTCSPSCGPPASCANHKICRKGACAQCTAQTCTCTSGLCLPASWSSGQSVSFE